MPIANVHFIKIHRYLTKIIWYLWSPFALTLVYIDFPRFIFQKIVIKDYSDILKIFINEYFSKRSNFHISQEFILK